MALFFLPSETAGKINSNICSKALDKSKCLHYTNSIRSNYITKSKEIYSSIYQMEMKKRELLHDQLGWYYSVGGHAPVQQDCRAPEFFHGDNFLMVCVEHNNGDWNKQPTYKLYIAE